MAETIAIEPYGGAAEIAFWPLLFLLIFLAWRLRARRIAAMACALLALAILLLGVLHDVFAGSTSLAAVHDIEIGQLIICAAFFIMFVGVAREVALGGWKKQDRVLGLFAIAIALFLFWGVGSSIVVLAQDLAWPWRTVEGDVTLLASPGRVSGRTSWKYLGPNVVRIGETQVLASTSLYRRLRLGQHVRAQVSRGSDFIRRIERGGKIDRI